MATGTAPGFEERMLAQKTEWGTILENSILFLNIRTRADRDLFSQFLQTILSLSWLMLITDNFTFFYFKKKFITCSFGLCRCSAWYISESNLALDYGLRFHHQPIVDNINLRLSCIPMKSSIRSHCKWSL